MRNSFQSGSVIRVPLKSGDVWRFKFREHGTQRSEFIGSVASMPTKSHAEKAAERFRRRLNSNVDIVTIAKLIAKFWLECPPDRVATEHSYRSIFKRIEDRFGSLRVDSFSDNILAVEAWLKDLQVIGRHPKKGKSHPVSPLYRGQVRNLLHLLMEKAMLWKHLQLDRNPMDVVKLRNTSSRSKEITILSLEQYWQLLDDPELPQAVKVMIQIAAALGLRSSEFMGLRWTDIDMAAGTVQIQRSVVGGKANDTKTISSRQALPLHESIVAVLQEWRDASPVVNGWVFGSGRTGRPLDKNSLREEYLKPAGERIGVEIGWHLFRHLNRAMMRDADTPIEAQKQLLRHAKLSTTIDVYGGNSKVEELRPYNNKVVEILSRRSA